MEDIDKKTITILIKGAEKQLDDAHAVGQPFTVRHCENLKVVIEYLKKRLDECTMRDLERC